MPAELGVDRAMMTDRLDASAIVCVHNGERFLPGLFTRLAAMNCGRFELILVDDGSADRTHQLLVDFQARWPQTTIISHDVNLGVSASRNRGIAAATRKFVWIADVDDDWRCDILDILTGAATRNRADAAICDAVLVCNGTERGVIGGGVSPSVVSGDQAIVLAFLGRIRGYTWNKLIARRIIASVSFAPVTMYTDFSAIMTALRNCASVVLLDQTLYRHHANAGSMSRGPLNDISALKKCLDVALAMASAVPALQARPGLSGYFEAWFYLIPMASASAAGSVSGLEPGVGISIARDRFLEIGLGSLLDYSFSTWLRALVVVIFGKNYSSVYLFARWTRNVRRGIREGGER